MKSNKNMLLIGITLIAVLFTIVFSFIYYASVIDYQKFETSNIKAETEYIVDHNNQLVDVLNGATNESYEGLRKTTVPSGYTAITNASEFKSMTRYGKYILMSDIDMSEISFAGIPHFGGILDGNYYKIKNLSISDDGLELVDTCYYLGIFNELESSAEIRRVLFENIKITCTKAIVSDSSLVNYRSYIGTIAGENSGIISDCTINRTTLMQPGRITTCNIGSAVGRNYGGTIERINSNATIQVGDLVLDAKLAGIAGINSNNGIIKLCSYTGNINGSTISTGSKNLAGITTINSGVIMYCYTSATITASKGVINSAGICPNNTGVIRACYSISTQNVSGSTTISGIADGGKVIRSYYNDSSIVKKDGDGELKSINDLMDKNTFDFWDFYYIWSIGSMTPILNSGENYYDDDFWEWHTRTINQGSTLHTGSHIDITDGINFYSYDQFGYKDYLYKKFERTSSDNKAFLTFKFELDETKIDYNAVEGEGFIFNASEENDYLNGDLLFISKDKIGLYRLDNVDVSNSNNSLTTTRELKMLEDTSKGDKIISEVYSEAEKPNTKMHKIEIITNSSIIIVIDNGEIVLVSTIDKNNHSGDDFGLITSYNNHSNSKLSTVRFNDICIDTASGIVPIIKQNELGQRLEGVSFKITRNNRKIAEGTTNKYGLWLARNLSSGDYILEETATIDGYKLDNTKYRFNIDRYNNIKDTTTNRLIDCFIITNEVDDRFITIEAKKVDDNNNPLQGATIEVFDSNKKSLGESAITDTYGKVEFTLELTPGYYYFKEIKAPLGYKANNNYYAFEVNNDKTVTYYKGEMPISPISITTIKNEKITAQVIKYEANSTRPLSGAEISLCYANGEIRKDSNNNDVTITTNSTGKIDFSTNVKLVPGKYYYKETKAPSGYYLNENIYTFTINNDGNVVYDDSNGILYNDKSVNYKVEYYFRTTDEEVEEYVLGETNQFSSKANEQVTAEQKTFTGFKYDDDNSNNIVTQTVKENGSTVLKMYYDREKYNIEYELNGGTAKEYLVDKYMYGKEIYLPRNIVKDDNTFIGWYDNPSCEGQITRKIEKTDTGNKKFYAKWSDGSYFITSDKYEFDNENNIKKISPDTSVRTLTSRISTNGSMNLVNSNGNAKSNNDLVVTGDKLQVTYNGQKYNYDVVVRGDINGDGKTSLLDLSILNQVLVNKATINGSKQKAADLNYDGKVSLLDLSVINQGIVGKISL